MMLGELIPYACVLHTVMQSHYLVRTRNIVPEQTKITVVISYPSIFSSSRLYFGLQMQKQRPQLECNLHRDLHLNQTAVCLQSYGHSDVLTTGSEIGTAERPAKLARSMVVLPEGEIHLPEPVEVNTAILAVSESTQTSCPASALSSSFLSPFTSAPSSCGC